MIKEIRKKFKDLGLRSTITRTRILKLFHENPRTSFSLSELHLRLQKEMDMVTVFRTLKVFEKAGLVQKLARSSGATYYMYTPHTYPGVDLPNQPKFKCRKCNFVEILPELPDNYMKGLPCLTGENFEITIEGLCPECNNT